MSDNEEYYHDKGQSDGYERVYDPPHGVMDDLTTWSDAGMDRNRRENHAYNLGYYHGRGQHDYNNDAGYDPPSGSEYRDAYDAGWESAKAGAE
jgi:hypothetical protein